MKAYTKTIIKIEQGEQRMITPAMKEQMRAEFEAWFNKEFMPHNMEYNEEYSTYTSIKVHSHWLAWRAALAAAPAQEPVKVTADDLWKNDALMSLNAELGLSMDQLAKVANVLGVFQQPAKQESWINAKERLPNTKEMVISARKKRDGTWGLDLNYWTVSNQYAYEYTHWMPLPLPPVSRSDEQPVEVKE